MALAEFAATTLLDALVDRDQAAVDNAQTSLAATGHSGSFFDNPEEKKKEWEGKKFFHGLFMVLCFLMLLPFVDVLFAYWANDDAFSGDFLVTSLILFLALLGAGLGGAVAGHYNLVA